MIGNDVEIMFFIVLSRIVNSDSSKGNGSRVGDSIGL